MGWVLNKARIILSGLALVIFYASLNSAWAFGGASCSACMRVGERKVCTYCSSAISGGVSIIEGAIDISEEIIHQATGMPAAVRASGQVGFPMLATNIESANANQTTQYTDVLDGVRNTLVSELQQMPFHHDEMTQDRRYTDPSESSPSAPLVNLEEEAAYMASQRASTSQEGESIKPVTDEFRKTGNLSLDGGSGDGQRRRDGVASDGMGTVAQIQSLMDTLRDENDYTLERLNASLFVQDAHRVLGDDAGSRSHSPRELIALYSALANTTDAPSSQKAVESAELPRNLLSESVNQNISDMRQSLINAVQNRYAQMRQPHTHAKGHAAYMREQIPGELQRARNRDDFNVSEDIREDVASDEEYIYLKATYRARSPDWQSTVATNDEYAARQVTQVSAERLEMSWERWQTRRDINMMLSQALSANLRVERQLDNR